MTSVLNWFQELKSLKKNQYQQHLSCLDKIIELLGNYQAHFDKDDMLQLVRLCGQAHLNTSESSWRAFQQSLLKPFPWMKKLSNISRRVDEVQNCFADQTARNPFEDSKKEQSRHPQVRASREVTPNPFEDFGDSLPLCEPVPPRAPTFPSKEPLQSSGKWEHTQTGKTSSGMFQDPTDSFSEPSKEPEFFYSPAMTLGTGNTDPKTTNIDIDQLFAKSGKTDEIGRAHV